jgi:hypothetical protein
MIFNCFIFRRSIKKKSLNNLMRNFLALTICVLLTTVGENLFAQLVVNGGTITIADNASIVVKGDFATNTNVLGPGKIIMNGSSIQQMNLNGFTVPNLEINSPGGVVLTGSARVGNTLNLVSGTLSTNPSTSYELIAPLSTTFTFASGAEIIGKVRRTGWVNGSNVIFNSPNMKVFTAGGTAPSSMLVSMIPNGDPTGNEREVKRTFEFNANGGTGFTADVTFPYKANELTASNNAEANLVPWYLENNEWNSKPAGNTNNVGSGFLTSTGIPATAFASSQWKLADPVYSFHVNVALRGPWNGTSMNSSLNSGGLIPLSQPYNTTPFNYTGTETVSAIPNANVVDWVLLELRKPTSGQPGDATSATIVGRKAAFLLNNGNIVDLDGVTPASLAIGKQGSAYIVVRHRNHLGVMSVLKPSNENGSFSNDFTVLSNSYKDPAAPSDPLVLLAGGSKYGLWAGDANKNGSVNATDVSAIKSSIANSLSGYLLTDANLSNSINGTDVSLTKATLAASGSGISVSRVAQTTIKTSLPD